MENQDASSSVITRNCTNFKNYLKNQFEIENFGEFICTYTFPFEEVEELKQAAAAAGKTPVSLRLYYGCQVDGSNHHLHMSLLDAQGEIIVDSSTLVNKKRKKTALPNLDGNRAFVAAAALAEERKCPPGGTSDRLINALFT